MATLSEQALRRLIRGGETSTVELKVAAPRPVDMAERLCGMANAQEGVVIIGVEEEETLTIQWDSVTLKKIPRAHITWYEEEGLSWSEMNLSLV
jgi:predicted HTH transcriptional regulator